MQIKRYQVILAGLGLLIAMGIVGQSDLRRPSARRPNTARWSSCGSRPKVRPAGLLTTVRRCADELQPELPPGP